MVAIPDFYDSVVTFDQGSEVEIVDSDPYLKCGVPLRLRSSFKVA